MTQNQINGEYSEFIGTYDQVVSYEFCNDVISTFDYLHNVDGVSFCGDDQFDKSNTGRFDWSLDLSVMSPKIGGYPDRYLNDVLFGCLKDYSHMYGAIKGEPFYSAAQKVQKTPAGGGYHVWHYENESLELCTRALVWMVYLNDDFEGGETEFLYQQKRIDPKQGRLLIWPAAFTHTHRGGLVLKGSKYVITGWFHLGK
jgi:hypothetical protein